MNPPFLIDDSEVECATVGEPKRQFQVEPMQAADDTRIVTCIKCSDPPFDLTMCRDRLALFFGKVLVYGKVIVEPSDVSTLAKYIADPCGLLDQALHVIRFRRHR